VKKVKIASRPLNSIRDSANAAIEPNPTAPTVATTAMKALLNRNRQNAEENSTEV